jgi:hypothetical protein
MKTILMIVAVGAVCFFIGLFCGTRMGNSYVEATDALNRASVLSVDLHIANDLHKGQVNEALYSVVSRIDASIVNLADRPKGVFYETNTLPALNFALAYRKTNTWMNNFGWSLLNTNDDYGIISNSIITSELQKLLAKP